MGETMDKKQKSNHLGTLLWKNSLIKRRHPISTIAEVMIPVLFVFLIGLLKTLMDDKSYPEGWPSGVHPGSLFTTGFEAPEYTMTSLLSSMVYYSYREVKDRTDIAPELQRLCDIKFLFQGHINTDTSSSRKYKIPYECAESIVPYKLAIVPDNEYTRDYFAATVNSWYPAIPLNSSNPESLVFPSFEDSTVFYDSEDALDEYIEGKEYGISLKNPKIYGAIVFKNYPKDPSLFGKFGSIKYSIRLNATSDSEGITMTTSETTDNKIPNIDNLQKRIRWDSLWVYSRDGFMTLQTLVARFLNCQPRYDDGVVGPCTVPSSTANASDRQMNSLLLDRFIKEYEKGMEYGKYLTGIPFPPLEVKNLTVVATEEILKPLRQAPQVYGHAGRSYPFPAKAYVGKEFYAVVKEIFGLVFILAFIFTSAKLITVLVSEKELKARELMKIMGVRQRTIVFAWYLLYIFMFFILSILVALAASHNLFSSSQFAIILVFFFFFSLNVLAYGYLVSTFFSKARNAVFIGNCIFFLSYFVTSAYSADSSENSKNFGCLLFPVALVLGVNNIAKMEENSIGMTFNNANTVIENFRFSTSLGMLFFNFVAYTLLAIYFEQVTPREFGVRKPWYFPCLFPFKWRSPSTRKTTEIKTDMGNSSIVEPVSADLRAQEEDGTACMITGLRKVFPVPGGEKVAVNSLNLNVYQGQILCLLGHNGAGKTTTISMLTGMIPPTSGDAIVNGYSIVSEMDSVRRSIGICPQHDVLYKELTVKEHLIFYGRIKGLSGEHLEEVVKNQIIEVGLTEKVNEFSTNLSGGMKRKLSLCIALIGDSSVVFLDEPTSGMDPYSRRSTWEMIQNNRRNRIIILTTHFMDEADILGDRIAIMAKGELKCCGSSLFLKNKFGAGYNLAFVRSEHGNTQALKETIMQHVPMAKLLSEVGTEVTFQLPLDASSSFPDFFSYLDQHLEDLGVSQYGISVTTMEEVFIKVAEAKVASDAEPQNEEKQLQRMSSLKLKDTGKTRLNEGFQLGKHHQKGLFMIHLYALIVKRFHNAKRDKKSVFYSAFCPLIILLISFILLSQSGLAKNQPIYALSTSQYPSGSDTPTPFVCETNGLDVCSKVMNPNVFKGAKLDEIDSTTFGRPPYGTATNLKLFDFEYKGLNESQKYVLRLGELALRRVDDNNVSSTQYGGYIVHGDENRFGYTIYVNTTSMHAAPIFKNAIDSAFYTYLASTSRTGVPENSFIEVENHPLPLTATSKAIFGSMLSSAAIVSIVVAFSFFPAAIAIFIVKEKEDSRNSKHQQLVSGVGLTAFWVANYVWDMIMYFVPFVSTLILIQLFDITSLTGSDCVNKCVTSSFSAVSVLLFLFGLAVIPFTYIITYILKSHASATMIVLSIDLLLGLVLMVVSIILNAIESTKSINKVLQYVWRLSPFYCLGNGLLKLATNGIFGQSSEARNNSAFGMDLCGTEIVFLVFESIIFLLIAVGIDYMLSYPKIKTALFRDSVVKDPDFEEDVDIRAERERVENGQADSEMLVLKGLRKTYPGGKVAVRNISLGLSQGECFGFLGINGAGKTSTMKMLTGDVVPTKGSGTVGGFDIMSEQLSVRHIIGYCPQFDALFDLLTVREHLELFARIKGVPNSELARVVDEKIVQLDLTQFEDKLAGTLSGGNKRKLSVAIALIGSPSVVFLDEPSTGMDPVARRFMWEVIAEISNGSRESTIVLTTHSMEECEALCSKVGIMVGGRLRCYGSIQHLKGRFGDGLMMLIRTEEPPIETLTALMSQIGDVQVLDRNGVLRACEKLGDPSRADLIRPDDPSGWSLANMLLADNAVKALSFCEWWADEDRSQKLIQFMHDTFNEVELLEKNKDMYRFKLKRDTSLANVFRTIEKVKMELGIREYSVSQTTLEQIFNNFAREQEEETGVARGFQQKLGTPKSDRALSLKQVDEGYKSFVSPR